MKTNNMPEIECPKCGWTMFLAAVLAMGKHFICDGPSCSYEVCK